MSSAASAATCTLASNTLWSNINAACAFALTAADDVVVKRNATLTVDVANAQCRNIQLGVDTGPAGQRGPGALVFNAGSQLTANTIILGDTASGGTISMAAGGTLLVGGFTVNVFGGWTPGTGSVQLTATNTLPSQFNANGYNNLTIASGTTTLSGTVSVAGNLVVNSGTTLAVGGSTLNASSNVTVNGTISGTGPINFTGAGATISGTGSVTDTGTLTLTNNKTVPSGSSLSFSGTIALGANTTVTNNASVTSSAAGGLTGVATSTWTNAANSTLNVSGPLFATGTLNASASGNLVNYQGAAQTVKSTTYYNLTLSGSGTKTMPAAALTINNDFSMQGSAVATSANTLSIGRDFSLAGTSRFTAGAALTVTRDIILGNGTQFTAGGFTHNLARNFTNNGATFVNTGSTFNLNGGAAQTIGGSSSTTFNDLRVANTVGGISLALDSTVAGTLTLVSGVVSTGSNTLITTANCNTPSVSRTSGHIAGFLRLRVPTGSPTCTFDTGDATNYRPITVAFSSVTTAGNVTATVSQAAGEHANIATSDLDSANDVNRFWTLTNGGVVLGSGYSATVTFVAGDVDVGADATTFAVDLWDGAAWNTTTAGSATATSTQASGITAFGDLISGKKSFVFGPATGSFNAFETSTGAGAITGVVKTKVAGTAFTLDIVAIASGSQYSAFSKDVTVDLIGNSATGTALDSVNCPTTFSTVLASFTATITGGRSSVSFAAVPNSWRDVRVRVRWPTSSPTVRTCSSDNFAVRPASLTIGALDATWETAGTARTLANTSASGGNVHKASTSGATTPRPFTVQASAVPASATNYDGTPSVVSGYPTCGTLCATVGTLGFGSPSWNASGGMVQNATANYSEAGTFRLQLEDASYASVDSGDGSTAAERTVPATATVEIGRFVPERFEFASPNTPQLRTFGSACASRSFTYIGQRFWFATPPSATVKAVNAAGATTTNYPISTSRPTLSETYSDSGAPATLDTASVGTPALSAPAAGTASYSPDSAGTLVYQRNNATPLAPFNASAISLSVSALDAADNGANQGIISSPTPLAFSNIAFDAGNEFRYGRAALLNAAGPSSVDIPVPLRAEYYAGTASGFVLNNADNCTSFSAASFKLFGYQGSLNAGNMPNSNISISGSVSAGLATTLKLLKPSPAVSTPGSVKICLDLDAGAGLGDTTCQAATPANRAYQQGPWSGATYDKDPAAQVNLGLYGSQPKNFIFLRENY
ncbi:MAG: hypothetical protein LC750_08640 [Actinobacteria bacterium]|nr:hypothetical protein [Actinomycetota bacterium]